MVYQMSIEESESDTVENKMPDILGPYKYAVRFCGFDLRPRKNIGVKILSCLIALALFIIMVGKVVTLFIVPSWPTLSVVWLDNLLWIAMTIYGATSGGSMAIWTWNEFIPKLERKLAVIRAYRLKGVNADRQISRPWLRHVRVFYFASMFALTWTLAVLRGVIYTLAPKSTNLTIHFRLNLFNVYAGDFPIVFIIIIISVTSTITFAAAARTIHTEIVMFNKQLKEASIAGFLNNPETLAAMSKQHLDIIAVVRFANKYLRFYLNTAPATAIITFMTCNFLLTSNYRPDMRLMYFIIVLLWTHTAGSILYILIGVPASIQEEIRNTMSIMIRDNELSTTPNEYTWRLYRSIIDRCKDGDTGMYFLRFIPVGRNAFHAILIISTLLVNLGGLMKTYYDYGHPGNPKVPIQLFAAQG